MGGALLIISGYQIANINSAARCVIELNFTDDTKGFSRFSAQRRNSLADDFRCKGDAIAAALKNAKKYCFVF